MLTTGATRLAVSRGQQTWYHFGSVATFPQACDRHNASQEVAYRYVTFILAVCCSSDATGLYILRRYLTDTQSNLSITRNIKQSLYNRFIWQHIVYNLSATGVTISHAQQSVRFTACSACRRPAAGGAIERSANNLRLLIVETPLQMPKSFRIFFPHLSKVFSRDAWLDELFNRP